MKRSIAFLLSFFFLLSAFTVPAEAASVDSEEISFDYFYGVLRQEYQKYGMDFTIERPNYDFVSTTDLLKEELNTARAICEGICVEVVEKGEETSPDVLEPYAMPASYYWEKELKISSNEAPALGYVSVKLYCSGDVDLQNGAVKTWNTNMIEKSSLNLAENNLTFTGSRTSNYREVMVYLDGSVKFSWTDPYTNSVFATNKYGPFLIEFIDPNSYLN